MFEAKTVSTMLAAVLAVAATAAAAPAVATTLEEIEERGKLVMLCWPHQESHFVRRMIKEYGERGLNVFGGVDVELMEAFAERLGVELEVRPVKPNFAALIPALLAGEGDVIASSLTITQARSEKVDFSLPYHTVHKVVVTRAGSPIDSLDDLRGKTAATVAGSSHEEHLHDLAFDDLEIRVVEFTLESYQAVAEGDADFTVVDSGSAERVLSNYAEFREQLEVAFTFPSDDHYGVAVRPGSDELLAQLNEFIADMRRSGRFESIKERNPPRGP